MGRQKKEQTSILENRITCPNCGHENKTTSLVCKRCGRLLQERNDAPEPRLYAKPKEAATEAAGAVESGGTYFGAGGVLVMHIRDSIAPLTVRLGDELIIGRFDPQNKMFPDLDLSLYDALDKGVSRRHAAIRRNGDALNVVDLDSPNGTFLNGQRLPPQQPSVLHDGDELRLGSLVMQIFFRVKGAT